MRGSATASPELTVFGVRFSIIVASADVVSEGGRARGRSSEARVWASIKRDKVLIPLNLHCRYLTGWSLVGLLLIALSIHSLLTPANFRHSCDTLLFGSIRLFL